METQQTTSSSTSSVGFDLDKYAGKDVPLPNSSLDLATLLQHTGSIRKILDAQASQVQGLKTQEASKIQQAADLNIDLGANAVIIEQAKFASEIQAQNSIAKAAHALGTNYAEQGEKLTGLADQQSEAKVRMDQASAAIRDKQSVNFLDNPLGWLINQFTVNGDIDAYNLASEDSDRAHQEYMRLNAETQTAAQTQQALKVSITEASAKAATDNIVLTAQQQQLMGSAKALGANADAVKQAYDMGTQKLQYEFSVFSAQKAEQQNRIALAHLELSKNEAMLRMQEKLKKDAMDSDLVDTINAGKKVIEGENYTPIRKGTIEYAKVVELVKSGSPLGKDYVDFYHAGEKFLVNGLKSISTSPADYVDMQSRGVNINAPGSEPVQQMIHDITAEVIAEAKQSGITKPEIIKQAINQRVEAKIAQMSKNVDWSSQKNLFNLPAFGDYINSPEIRDLSVVKKVIAPIVTGGGDLNDPNKLLAVVSSALAAKKITYGEALETTALIQKGVAINSAQKQFRAFGIVPPRSWKVELDSGGSVFNRNQVIDMTQPDQFGRALIRSSLGANNFDKLVELSKQGNLK